MTSRLITDLGMQLPTPTSKQKRRYGLYECPSCKKHWKAQTADIKRGNTTQCRSCSKTTHGLSDHKLYNVWSREKQRCTNPKDLDYKNYGAKRIKFSTEFNDFLVWLKYIESLPSAYKPGYTIDRINNNGNYERGNLRWASKATQQQNTRLLRTNNTSGFRGVSKSGNKWKAQIGANNRQIRLGYHSTDYFAAFARDMYVIANRLEHPLNFPSLVDVV